MIAATTTKSDVHARCIIICVSGVATNSDGQLNIRRWRWSPNGGPQVIITTILRYAFLVRYLSVELVESVDEQLGLSAIY